MDHDDDTRVLYDLAAQVIIGNSGNRRSAYRYFGRVRELNDRKLLSVLGN